MMVIIGNLEKITIGGTGKFFPKVKLSLVISTTFEFSHQKHGAKIQENHTFQTPQIQNEGI